jgi:hypothetical protein
MQNEIHSAKAQLQTVRQDAEDARKQLRDAQDGNHQLLTYIAKVEEAELDAKSELRTLQQAHATTKEQLRLANAEVDDLTTCAVCQDDAMGSPIRCTQGHPTCMVCLQEAGAKLRTHCCAEGCTAELRLPPGLTPFNLANESHPQRHGAVAPLERHREEHRARVHPDARSGRGRPSRHPGVLPGAAADELLGVLFHQV